MFECIFVFDLFALICAWLILSGENYKKNYARLRIKISIIKLNNIKFRIRTAKTLAFRGCHIVSLCFKPRMISKTRKKPLNQKNKTKIINNKKDTYVYKTSNSTRHLVPTERSRFPDRFSFGSR